MAGYRRVWLAATALMLAAGCAGADPPTAPRLLESADLRLPLDDYLLSPEQTLTVANAYRALARTCLREFGFAAAGDLAPRRLVGPRTLNERRYGLTDPVMAAVDGFGLGDREPSTRDTSGQPGPEELAVLVGNGPAEVNGRPVPEGGCGGRAQRELKMNPSGVDSQLAQRLAKEAFDRSRADARVKDATAAWSACMHETGLHYAGPLDAVGDPAFTGGPSARELTAAATDIECKRRTNLVGIWFTVEASYQDPLISANLDVLRKVREANAITLRLAQAVHP